jgi:hypothetical protein
MMKEIVRVQDALEQALPTRAVAERLQLLPAPQKSGAKSQKPRLVRVTSQADLQAKSAEAPPALNAVRALHG